MENIVLMQKLHTKGNLYADCGGLTAFFSGTEIIV